MTTTLTHEWTIIASVEGGEVLARLEENYIRVSYPESLSQSHLTEILADKEIEVDLSVDPVYQDGESQQDEDTERESVALFKLKTEL